MFFYTYDETVHEYDFTGEQVERTILDPSIKKNNDKANGCFLGDIRVNLNSFSNGCLTFWTVLRK